MRLSIPSLFTLAALALAGEASAQASIGLVAPLEGPSAILGAQMKTGAELAAETLSNPSVRLTVANDDCTAEGGARAAGQLVAARVQVVVGFLCMESIESALPILKDAQIPTIAVGVRADSLTDRKTRTGWLVNRLGPRADGERNAAGQFLARLWRQELFAIVDDGTIYGRELAESVRAAAEQAGLSAVFFDTFRPQLDNQIGLAGRLRRAGATHVFAGGDRDDIAIIARDGSRGEARFTVASGETLRALGDVPLTAGTLMVAVPEWDELATPAVAKAFADKKLFAKGYTLPAYAAVEIAHAMIVGAEADSRPPASNISGRTFPTAIGDVVFDDKGEMSGMLYRLYRFNGQEFSEVEVP